MEKTLTIDYIFTPAERRTQDHPGYPAEVEICGDDEFLSVWDKLSESAQDEIENILLQREEERARDAAEYHAEERAESIREGSALFDFGATLSRMYSHMTVRAR